MSKFVRTWTFPRSSSFALFLGLALAGLAGDTVSLWETNEVIPTYRVAPADPNPRFYSGRTYQGARATFYPYPVMDRLTDERVDRTYRLVYLENAYVRLAVLPELGGRIFSAIDKSNGYDFFYRQHVVKPALIGMLGAWISGGVEWNVPHHHRATSFMPVDCTTEARADGSQTVWVGETEWRHRLKWLVGITLRPDRSYLELNVKLFNRTPFAHPVLFWINPAVHANDQYQVIFPPDAQFAVQHGKPEFARWPVAHEVYGGVDYTAGVDISWWKHHPSPVSFFCFHSDMDFFGGYDHGRQAGVLHWADRHVAPGKKFFEWGTGPEGEMWSQILTDTDGPYLELMAGAWSDNQPDYSWLEPGEVRTWKHYWYPIRELGGAKNATPDAALNLDLTNGVARLAFNTTAAFPDAVARLMCAGTNIFEAKRTLSPAQPFAAEIPLEAGTDPTQLVASLHSAAGRELVSWQPAPRRDDPLPEPVHRPSPPKDIPTVEELYLTGLRIEQLYSPSFEAAPYYEEALRRDPGDYRANTALGVLHARAWRWADAEEPLRAAVSRATANYIRPKDTEALYYLGVVLRARGQFAEAIDAYSRAAWSPAWQAPAHTALAELACRRGDFAKALEHANQALTAEALHTGARNLKVAILRRLRAFSEAEDLARATLSFDPLDFHAANELCLAQRQGGWLEAARATLDRLRTLMRGDAESALELATAYEAAGLWDEAIEVLERQIGGPPDTATGHPMLFYHLAWCAEQAGRIQSLKLYRRAAQMPPDFCFPHRFEEERMLRQAVAWNPDDARAFYYLGNLLYDRQPEAAVVAWEKSRDLRDDVALVHRNLGLAYAQTFKDPARAVASLERAVRLAPAEPRFLYELDLQYEAAGTPVAQRLAMLTDRHEVVALRDDTCTREIVLLTVAGQHDRALELLTTRRFHNWEGSGEIHGLYVDARLHRGHARYRAKDFAGALQDYLAALEYPTNLEVGRPRRDRRAAQVSYFIGRTRAALGETDAAKAAFEQAAAHVTGGPSEVQFVQALALMRLDRADEARRWFEGLVKHGMSQREAAESPDYFAKFGERQSARLRNANAHYLAGLGHLGLGERDAAMAQFQQAVESHPAHLGASERLAHPDDVF